MGFQDCLHLLRIPYGSQEAVEFADRSMEAIAYFAYWASTELAEERGRYASYKGSLWDRGIMPRHVEPAARGAWRIRRYRQVGIDGLEGPARAHQAPRNAQLQLPCHRSDRDDREHHRGFRLDRADLSEPVREVEPVGRVHRRQRIS